jgi:hypothetical protein
VIWKTVRAAGEAVNDAGGGPLLAAGWPKTRSRRPDYRVSTERDRAAVQFVRFGGTKRVKLADGSCAVGADRAHGVTLVFG